MDTHTIEFIVVVLGGVVGIIRLLPTLRQAAIFLQVILLVTEIFGFYLKKNPRQKQHLQFFISDAIDHYLKTHPKGKIIARKTDLDEKVTRFREKHHFHGSNSHTSFHKYLGIKVDNKEK